MKIKKYQYRDFFKSQFTPIFYSISYKRNRKLTRLLVLFSTLGEQLQFVQDFALCFTTHLLALHFPTFNNKCSDITFVQYLHCRHENNL